MIRRQVENITICRERRTLFGKNCEVSRFVHPTRFFSVNQITQKITRLASNSSSRDSIPPISITTNQTYESTRLAAARAARARVQTSPVRHRRPTDDHLPSTQTSPLNGKTQQRAPITSSQLFTARPRPITVHTTDPAVLRFTSVPTGLLPPAAPQEMSLTVDLNWSRQVTPGGAEGPALRGPGGPASNGPGGPGLGGSGGPALGGSECPALHGPKGPASGGPEGPVSDEWDEWDR